MARQKHTRSHVLIAPLWNWNHADVGEYKQLWVVLIAPLWNWNIHRQTFQHHRSRCSNRTFMELKYQKETFDYEAYQVLIAPLWNWNNILREKTQNIVCSNRTFMELKFPGSWVMVRGRVVLIAPLWNWNLSELITHDPEPCSNRTFMELKSLCCTSHRADHPF